MSLTKFTSLDFTQIKTEIKDYLRANSNFTDFDFEGSNLSMLIDILAYNSYLTSYNANMVANEVFLDSATLRDNVVGLARNIGYVPRSHRAGTTTVNFTVDFSSASQIPRTLTLKKGLVATSEGFGGTNFTFSTIKDVTTTVVNKVAVFENVEIYEGSLLTKNFTVVGAQKNQRFILDNPFIDTRTISVDVKSYSGAKAGDSYEMLTNLIDLDSKRKMFMVNEIEDERYELIFGDGIFGRKPVEGEFITASYLSCSGENSNNTSRLTFSGRVIDPNTGGPTNGVISPLSVNDVVTGSEEIESVSSIRKYAPKVFSTQYRAVTAADFESLIPTIYPDAESVSVFGGEELDPPQYGKVFISVKPEFGRYLSRQIKENILSKLKKYSVAGIVPQIIDLKYLFIEIETSVYFDPSQTNNSGDLRDRVIGTLNTYAESDDLNKFGSRFKYSKVGTLIDSVDRAITSNITKVVMRRDMSAVINAFTDYEICYGNQFHVKESGFNIKSSGFAVAGLPGILYMGDVPNADKKTGTLIFFRKLSETQYQIVKNNAGTVDYVKGEVMVYPINISSTSIVRGENSIIEIQAIPESFDIIGLQDLYLQLSIDQSTFTMVNDTISSGADISGSNYASTSSFANGSLTR